MAILRICAFIVAAAGLIATCAFGAARVNILSSKTPEADAERAFISGDQRLLVIPVCQGKPGGEVIPGWPSQQDSDEVQAEMRNAHRPLTCKELSDDPNASKFRRAAAFAKTYNMKMLDLRKHGRK